MNALAIPQLKIWETVNRLIIYFSGILIKLNIM